MTATGQLLDDESCADEGGSGLCTLKIDASSKWIVTENSCLGMLENHGTILDTDGKKVSIMNTSGSVLHQGDSSVVVTVSEYKE